jgi:WD40 repeat protein
VTSAFRWGRRAILLLALLLAACGPALTPTPVALSPTGTTEQPTTPSPVVTTAPAPTYTAIPPTPATAPLDGEGLSAWTVTPDGAVYVLDSTTTVVQLSPGTLAPLAQSSPLFEEPGGGGDGYLLASDRYVFVGSAVISETLVLDRGSLDPVGQWQGFGPMALDPGRRLLMIPLGLPETWPLVGNFEIWGYGLDDLSRSPERLRRDTGASLDDLAVDPGSRRLYLLTSNVNASPPHRGQNYEILDLDSLETVAAAQWERGSLTRPVVDLQTGEILGSRIGLNATRRFLILGPDGQEMRSRPSLDGQPAIDASGEWIYLLRDRGLWVLHRDDLSVQSVLAFSETPPRDLALSPDGERLYLFGNGWLRVLSTAELRNEGLVQVSPLPASWFSSTDMMHQVEPRVYPSPHMEEDGVVFAQVLGAVQNVLETYFSTDGGRSWALLPSLLQPGLVGASYLSLSPDFATDATLTARFDSGIVRSTDGGMSWQPWQVRIAFVSERDGNEDIYTMDGEGNDVQRLTDTTAGEENPAWSPAWTRLAFQSDRSGNWDIYSMRVDCDPLGPGAEQDCDLRQLTDDPADDLLPAWSPDGRYLAFVSSRDGNPEIYVMDADGAKQRRLTFNPTGDWRPAWLPDSEHLLFVSGRNGNNDIYQLAVPSPQERPLLSEPEIEPVIVSPADDRDPAVLAGPVDRVLFLSDRDGTMRTYTTDPTVDPMSFTNTGLSEAHPATLPGEYYGVLISAERDGDMGIYLASRSSYTVLTASPGFDGQPAGEATPWKPDSVDSLRWLARH